MGPSMNRQTLMTENITFPQLGLPLVTPTDIGWTRTWNWVCSKMCNRSDVLSEPCWFDNFNSFSFPIFIYHIILLNSSFFMITQELVTYGNYKLDINILYMEVCEDVWIFTYFIPQADNLINAFLL